MSKNTVSASVTRADRWKEAAGLVIILGALFILVALLTYDAADLGYGAYPANAAVHNKGGAIGALLAEFLYRYLGLTAFLVAAVGGAWGGAIFFRQTVHALVVKLVASLLVLYASAILLALQPLLAPSHLGLEGAMPTLGGAYGDIGRVLLARALGVWGTWLAVLFSYGLATLLATPWMPHQILKALARAASAVGRWGATRAWPAIGAAFSRMSRRRDPIDTAFSEGDASRKGPQLPAAAPPPSVLPARAESMSHPLAGVTAAPEPAGKPSRTRETASHATGDSPLPPVDLFEDVKTRNPLVEEIDTRGTAQKIEQVFAQFNIPAKVTGAQRGPIITAYFLEPGQGVRVNKIFGMDNDIALALHSPSVRIVGPIPDKGLIVEVPNPCAENVRMRALLTEAADRWSGMPLPLLLGKDAAGKPIIRSLSELPHLLVAGTTGSGKSVCLNAIITSLLVSTSPSHLKLLLVDPKIVELSDYKDIPHLWAPVITDMKHEVPRVLEWLCREMDDRFDLLSAMAVKDIAGYNRLKPEEIHKRLQSTARPIPDPLPDHLPYIVLLIDEFGELMNVASKEVNQFVQRLAQKARAVGIHVVLATQHPSTVVVSPEIKANFPARIAFQVSSQVNSRVVLDRNGAERLLGKGDMLVLFPGMADPIRAQGTYVSDKEIKGVVDFLRRQGGPQYHPELMEEAEGRGGSLDDSPISDEIFDQAVRIVLGSQRGSVSLLQRRLGIGYSRAARLIDMMAERQIVGDYQGSKAREVLMTLEQWENLRTPVGAERG